MLGVSNSAVGQAVAQMGLRAARAVLLVPVGGDWTLAARWGLHYATHMWGGAGFVVVPVGEAPLDDAVLAALRAYDPDYVVQPDANFPFPIDAATRKNLREVQEAISAACSNYRGFGARKIKEPDMGDLSHPLFGMPSAEPMGGLVGIPGTPAESAFGVDPAVGGVLGVAAAVRWGLAPAPLSTMAKLDPDRARHAIWMLAECSSHRVGLLDLGGIIRESTAGPVQEHGASGDFRRTLVGLEPVTESGWDEAPVALVVVGDDPNDFALATAWDRTYGLGVWIPDRWWRDRRSRQYLAAGIDGLAATSLHKQRREVVFTSTSLSDRQLARRIKDFQLGTMRTLGQPLIRPAAESMCLPATRLEFPRYGKSHYGIRGRFQTQWSTTVEVKNGTVDALMLPPIPDVANPDLRDVEESLAWHVDFVFVGSGIPVTTALPNEILCASGQDSKTILVRSARSGISFEARRSDWVSAGAPLEQRLSRPRLRFPSLLDWAAGRAACDGLNVRLSKAGEQAMILASQLGSRHKLTEVAGSTLLPALQAFLAQGLTSANFSDDEGCVLHGRTAYLTFKGLCVRSGSADKSATRVQVDDLLEAGILQRGLILNCGACSEVAFVNVIDLGETYQCGRCRRANTLRQPRWRNPPDEPLWFYDLHPLMRNVLDPNESNGHVPLLLSNYLERQSNRIFDDAPEFELVGADRRSAVETDLLALVGRQLVLAEAKTTTKLHDVPRERRKAAEKRVLAAALFGADQIVLGTTQSSWEASSVTALIAAINARTWTAGQPPVLRAITGLGTVTISDEVVPLTE
jgi:hypothetical protein